MGNGHGWPFYYRTRTLIMFCEHGDNQTWSVCLFISMVLPKCFTCSCAFSAAQLMDCINQPPFSGCGFYFLKLLKQEKLWKDNNGCGQPFSGCGFISWTKITLRHQERGLLLSKLNKFYKQINRPPKEDVTWPRMQTDGDTDLYICWASPWRPML